MIIPTLTHTTPVGADRLGEILDVIKGADYASLKRNLDRVWHHFTWASVDRRRCADEPWGSDALAVTLDMLCRHRRASLPPGSPLLALGCLEESQRPEYLM